MSTSIFTATMRSGRPTLYRGIQMRSRLEASFAQTMDSVLVEWKYEPQCFADKSGQYLPDFWISDVGEGAGYVEVKPEAWLFAELPSARWKDVARWRAIIRASEAEANFFLAVGRTDQAQGWYFWNCSDESRLFSHLVSWAESRALRRNNQCG